ncbi:DNA-3-methyladenine glycosylase [Pedobacter sp. Hv1]|uniref:DNA-3-methyladenine glycosylase family protein n=1 Tax=Pedobacter sp. Hv1 TaxID=1740090 RepID=UPI0006D8CC17|nr:DNA-3-methyladenine glycosylase [Pedobacter sp. Hv1]KQB98823.1 3-methyladenine DNA glycosylase [Pedobacter sp. Hv1]
MFEQFTPSNYHQICDSLGLQDEDLKSVFTKYGYPPLWTRPNTFESLVHIILEQQVSLASALATLNKLRDKLKDITPEGLLLLSDEELRACYFSKQKTIYARHLAQALVKGELDLAALETLSNDEIRQTLSQLKGIGNWTIDVYLMFVLQRTDLFPIGDLAAVNALKQLKRLPTSTSREELLAIAETWKPHRTVATMLLWHYYLSTRGKK